MVIKIELCETKKDYNFWATNLSDLWATRIIIKDYRRLRKKSKYKLFSLFKSYVILRSTLHNFE
jgi:hypothetical protein